ncbi:Trehalase [Zootermopsis nevadensis]|uniref:Trehalase n=1 Tax=Zootermopsis nevadensis TaxID=136037 RepID=A0A067R5E2_ZOONE|nr:Trehalase [Zootermopsis nevadensis]
MNLNKLGAVNVLLIVTLVSGDSYPPPCSSNVYCYGELLHTVQMKKIYHDSKTFVDMKMKQPPNETLESFQALMKRTTSDPTIEELENFLSEKFEPAGSEFEKWDPSDWIKHPKFLDDIVDTDFREWGKQLNDLWKFLGRKMKDEVGEHQELYSIIYVPHPVIVPGGLGEHQELYSIIYVPHPVIVPGGRFREFYYWDSYWIIRGLLLSEMYTTVKGMLGNFFSIVENYGCIPNGGRIYYAKRSQPPMLLPMMKSYLDATNDITFLRDNIDILEREFDYWMTNHTISVEKDGKRYTLARYKDASSGPRPESYWEDVSSAEEAFRTDEEREAYYSELKAAAESGWDFSSRWFIQNATNKGTLIDLKTRYIIPVDLNSILFWNARLLVDFYTRLNITEKSDKYRSIADEWLEAVTAVLWHDEVGAWLDYDSMNEVKRDYFYPTNVAPLWTGCYKDKETQVGKIMKYLQKTQIMGNLGGIPTTLEHSGEQWDYPNAWPPLQYIMIMGLDNTDDDWAKQLAFEMTERWVRSNYKAFNETGAMYEKYDATVPGGHGGGGEYEIQVGFGWTNGVIMELLHKYGDRLTARDRFTEPDSRPNYQSDSRINVAAAAPTSSVKHILTGFVALLVTFVAGYIG